MRAALLPAFLPVLCILGPAQTTWHVQGNGTPGGAGTPASPFGSIQQGIVAAIAGDTVIVQPGVYLELINLLGKAITVRSANGPAATVIDANSTGVVVRFETGEGPSTILDGFSIVRGSSGIGLGSGGAVWCTATSPTIRNCVLNANQGRGGAGGITCSSGAMPWIERCRITGNTGGGPNCPGICGAIAPGGVGGMRSNASSPTLMACIIDNNVAGRGRSGGLWIEGGSATLVDCVFSGNTGGFYNSLSGVGAGGIQVVGGANVLVVNCTVARNTGGAGTTALAGGPGGMTVDGASVAVWNSIFWSNVGSTGAVNEILVASGSASLAHCDVQGGFAGPANLALDPAWVDPLADDFHLRFGSPCIDAGNNGAAGLPATDYEGDPRIFHGTADIGADESILGIEIVQPAGPGTPVTAHNHNLSAGNEYFNVFSLEPCPQGPGSGPLLGLCANNFAALLAQVSAPVGTFPFHFLAPPGAVSFGPYSLPPMTIDAVTFDATGGILGPVSRVTRFAIQ